MDLVGTSERSRVLRTRVQWSTGMPIKVTTFCLTVRITVFEFEVEVADDV